MFVTFTAKIKQFKIWIPPTQYIYAYFEDLR
jgi:hypothetical protein